MTSEGNPADAPVEIELKLGLPAEAMEALLASPLLRQHARGTLRSREMRGVYYDTADHRLRSRGAALRVREAEGRFVQTLKTAKRRDVAHAQRGEWEVEVPDARPRPDAFGDPGALDATGLLLPEELRPVFETRVRRRSLLVGWADAEGRPAEIEAAFDEGRVVADGGGEVPISELELELVRGDAQALFALAEALRELAPLRLEPLDKAARGWFLATGEPPPAAKALPVALDRKRRVDDALHAILSATLRHWLDNEPAAADGRDAEGLHQLRVALRRLRSAFALFADALGEDPRERWGEEVRWLLGRLGPARDLDVLTGELLPPLLEARGRDAALLAFREIADARRAEAQAAVAETLRSQRYADLAFGLAAWVARRGWREGADVDVRLRQREGIVGFAAGVLHRRHRQVLKRGRHFARLTPPERHRVRIAVKKLRYGVDFFADLFPRKRLQAFRKASTRMQERLGHLNDVDVASRLVRELLDPLPAGDPRAKAAALGGGQLVGWYAQQVAGLEPETVEAWEAFTGIEPFWDGGRR
jgi:triphosphatase